MNEQKVFGGLEGGASDTKVVLLSSSGTTLHFEHFSQSTNHWLIGINECLARIAQMLSTCLTRVENVSKLESLCLCLSGCEDKKTNQLMSEQFILRFPHLAKKCFVTSDTMAPLLASGFSSGVILIAGTGSNCLLFDEDGRELRCGGWGHILGDYGSGFWVSLEAIKAVIETDDNFRPREGVEALRKAVRDHFGIEENWSEILDSIYARFDKKKFSCFCQIVAKIAKNGDSLAANIFWRAGRHLGRHVRSVVTRGSNKDIEVICVGSLFKSWDLLAQGFFAAFLDLKDFDITLRRLKISPAVGAALMAAKNSGNSVDQLCEDNCALLAILKNGIWNQF